MADDRLPTGLWVDAHLRRCHAAAVPVYVVHKGAYAAGTVMVKIVLRTKGCVVLSQARGMDGELGWLRAFDEAPVDESRADAYIRRSIERDPDLWVIEVEDETGQNPFEGKIL